MNEPRPYPIRKPDRELVKARIMARLVIRGERGKLTPSRYLLGQKLKKTVIPRLVEQVLNTL